MSKGLGRTLSILTVAGALGVVSAAIVSAQQGKYPIMEQVAKKVIAKYQTTSCADLAASKQKAPTADEAATMQKAVAALRADPQMRTAFLNIVAAPIANKMFECGMIP